MTRRSMTRRSISARPCPESVRMFIAGVSFGGLTVAQMTLEAPELFAGRG